MAQERIALLLEDALLTVEELAFSCAVSREWVIEHVHAGLVSGEFGPDPREWRFSGSDLLRLRRVVGLERDFENSKADIGRWESGVNSASGENSASKCCNEDKSGEQSVHGSVAASV